jgi:hypothetical protein
MMCQSSKAAASDPPAAAFFVAHKFMKEQLTSQVVHGGILHDHATVSIKACLIPLH